MYLMRIGAPGAEKPAARVDGEHYVDLSDVVTDFDEAFFAGEGIERAAREDRRHRHLTGDARARFLDQRPGECGRDACWARARHSRASMGSGLRAVKHRRLGCDGPCGDRASVAQAIEPRQRRVDIDGRRRAGLHRHRAGEK